MKLALLGDIHGNDLALEAVLAAASSRGVEKLLITGDLVGYYFAPRKVLELLQGWDKHIVRGNHEGMLDTARTDADFLMRVDAKYGGGLREALDQLSESQLDELCGLPYYLDLNIGGCRILLCHGAPWDTDQYVYPDANQELLERCAVPEFDLIILGHTHYPMRKRVGRVWVVNPGSVGQPRNRHPGAYWAIFDTESRELGMHCENYDARALIAESRRRHPGIPYLAEVLERT